jgi:hypothetical protein
MTRGSGGGGSAGSNADTISEWIYFSKYMIIIIAVIILVIAFRILIGYALEIGSRKFFVQSAQYKNMTIIIGKNKA